MEGPGAGLELGTGALSSCGGGSEKRELRSADGMYPSTSMGPECGVGSGERGALWTLIGRMGSLLDACGLRGEGPGGKIEVGWKGREREGVEEFMGCILSGLNSGAATATGTGLRDGGREGGRGARVTEGIERGVVMVGTGRVGA